MHDSRAARSVSCQGWEDCETSTVWIQNHVIHCSLLCCFAWIGWRRWENEMNWIGVYILTSTWLMIFSGSWPNLFAMFTILLQACVVYAFSYAFFKLIRKLFVRSALDNLPGPSSQSFSFGNCSSVWNGPSYRLSISRCFSTTFQSKRMGLS